MRRNAYFYELPCTKRGVRFFPMGVRRGLIATFADDKIFGVAEIAPFLRRYTEADVLGELHNLSCANIATALHFEGDFQACTTLFRSFSYPVSWLLSAAHFFHASSKQVREYPPRRSLRLAALIELSEKNEAIALAQTYLAQGYSCLKIKIGSSIVDEIDKIKTIAALAGDQVSLRLDANKALSLADACTLLKGLRRVNIEYIEEPLADHTLSKSLFFTCGVPIALDESCAAPFDFSIYRELMATYFIIKPERFSSVYELLDVAKRAQASGMTPIFSHCFECEITSLQSLNLISELQLFDYAHGIVPEGFFKRGLLTRPLRSFRGQLLVDQCPRIDEEVWTSAITSTGSVLRQTQ